MNNILFNNINNNPNYYLRKTKMKIIQTNYYNHYYLNKKNYIFNKILN